MPGKTRVIENTNYPQNQNRPDSTFTNMSLNNGMPSPDIYGNHIFTATGPTTGPSGGIPTGPPTGPLTGIPTGMEAYPANPSPDMYTTGNSFPSVPSQTYWPQGNFSSQSNSFLSSQTYWPQDNFPSQSNSFLSSQPPDGLANPEMLHRLQLLERRVADSEMNNTYLSKQLSEMAEEMRELRQAFNTSQNTMKKLVEKLHKNDAGEGKEAGTEHDEKADDYVSSFALSAGVSQSYPNSGDQQKSELMINLDEVESPQTTVSNAYDQPTPANPDSCSPGKVQDVPTVHGNILGPQYPGPDNSYYPGPDNSYYPGPDNSYYPRSDNSYSPRSDNSRYPGPNSFRHVEPTKESAQAQDTTPSVTWPGLPTLQEDNRAAMPLPNARNLHPPQSSYNASGSYGHQTEVESPQTTVSNAYDQPTPANPGNCSPGKVQDVPTVHGNILGPQYPGPDNSYYPGPDNSYSPRPDNSYSPRWDNSRYPGPNTFRHVEPTKESAQAQDTTPSVTWPGLPTLQPDNRAAMPLPNARNLHPPQSSYNASGSYGHQTSPNHVVTRP
ncbi:uncharacterized protein LOC132087871 [Daphnia carinata]|uniref:uncharacterized protein LOC132087871 n=1 Tax=Daphnia carinata TaxID=120202 RepID=UPI0028695050|nr:uncharacterized protein LOC132087871 [Daphnia carinata]